MPALPPPISDGALRSLHEHILASVSDGVHVIALDGTVLIENDASARMLGWHGECLVGKHGHRVIHHHHESGEAHALEDCPIYQTALDGVPREIRDDVFWRADGGCFPVEHRTAPLRDEQGQRYGVVVVFRDTSERRRREAELHRQAHFDPVTGLPNRSLFADRLAIALAQAERQQSALALVYIDLDGFKPVNDQHGHAAGDLLLKAVGARLQQLLRSGDTLARVGGDEFVALLSRIDDAGEACRVGERILAALKLPFELDEGVVQIGGSLGIAVFPQHGQDAAQLLRAADAAMYAVKRAGKGACVLFEPPTHAQSGP